MLWGQGRRPEQEYSLDRKKVFQTKGEAQRLGARQQPCTETCAPQLVAAHGHGCSQSDLGFGTSAKSKQLKWSGATLATGQVLEA
jgi:hypothetical protein